MENYCKNCEYFVMHYVPYKRKYVPIDFGHCFFPRIKSRDAMTKACVHFIQQKLTKKERFYNKCWGQAMNLTPLACKK